jgi:hypothetical protein
MGETKLVLHMAEGKSDEKLKSEIAWKIIDGYRLDPSEFETAKAGGLLQGKQSYGEYVALCYEDDVNRGWLCPQPLFRSFKKRFRLSSAS